MCTGFNPCSFGCQSESCRPHRLPTAPGVSILVLLDVSLKGCASFLEPPDLDVVSILVLLDVSLKADPQLQVAVKTIVFQSLFFWMSV